MKVTDKQIRTHLYHGEGCRVVKVKRNGEVFYHGTRSDIDRTEDFWHFGGYRGDLAREVEACLTADSEYCGEE